jgi:hypothetical protein
LSIPHQIDYGRATFNGRYLRSSHTQVRYAIPDPGSPEILPHAEKNKIAKFGIKNWKSAKAFHSGALI